MTQAFNLSQLANKVNTSGQLDASTGLYNQTPVANGGTGSSSLTANNVLLGNGTSALQTVAPGTANNVLTSDGTTWTSSPIPFPIIQTQAILTGSSTWNKPTTGDYQWVKIELWAGGGGGGKQSANSGGGGGGAYNFVIVPLTWLGSSETYSVGAGGAARSTNGVGNVGGSTTFTITNSPNGAITINAYGGGGGGGSTAGATYAGGGGGGGGIISRDSKMKPSKVVGRHSLLIAYPYIQERFRRGVSLLASSNGNVEQDGTIDTTTSTTTTTTTDSSTLSEGQLNPPLHALSNKVLPPVLPPKGVDIEKWRAFYLEFGHLLLLSSSSNSSAVVMQDEGLPNDSALLWSKDGGAAELQSRRESRTRRAAEAMAFDSGSARGENDNE